MNKGCFLTLFLLPAVAFAQTTTTKTHETSTPKSSTHATHATSSHSTSTHSTTGRSSSRAEAKAAKKEAELQRFADISAANAHEAVERVFREAGLTPPEESASVPVKPGWNGKRFEPEFFSENFGKEHKFPITAAAITWRGMPFEMNSAFSFGGSCFVLSNSIPNYWFYGAGALYTFIDESCIETLYGGMECSYFITNYAVPGQRLPITVTNSGCI